MSSIARGSRIGLTATVTGGIVTAAAARRGAATVALGTPADAYATVSSAPRIIRYG